MIIAHRFIGGITVKTRSQSVKRTNDNSPPIHRWDHAKTRPQSVKRTNDNSPPIYRWEERSSRRSPWNGRLKESVSGIRLQPSASRTIFYFASLLPPINRWATINRPLHGLYLYFASLLPPMNRWATVNRPPGRTALRSLTSDVFSEQQRTSCATTARR